MLFTFFQVFRDSDSVEIFDVEEQRTKVNEDAQSLAELHHSIYANLNLKSKVFDISLLVLFFDVYFMLFDVFLN